MEVLPCWRTIMELLSCVDACVRACMRVCVCVCLSLHACRKWKVAQFWWRESEQPRSPRTLFDGRTRTSLREVSFWRFIDDDFSLWSTARPCAHARTAARSLFAKYQVAYANTCEYRGSRIRGIPRSHLNLPAYASLGTVICVHNCALPRH